MAKRVLRYDVPVDADPHSIPDARIVFVRRDPNPFGLGAAAQVWIEVPTPDDWPVSEPTVGTRQVQVVETGDPVPNSWVWLASFADGATLLHLFGVA